MARAAAVPRPDARLPERRRRLLRARRRRRHLVLQQIARPARAAPRLRMPVARLDRLIQVLYEQRADALQLAVGKPATLLANGSAPGAHAGSADRRPDPRPGARGGRRGRGRAPRRRRGVQLRLPLAERAGDGRAHAGRRRPAGRGAGRRPGGRRAGGPSPPAGAAPSWPRRARPWTTCSACWSTRAPPTSTSGPASRRCFAATASWCARTCPPLSGERLEPMLAEHHVARASSASSARRATPTGPTRSPGLARFRCNAGRDRHGPMAVFRVIPTTRPHRRRDGPEPRGAEPLLPHQGPRGRHRPDRLGQDHDARGAGRPDQPHAHATTSSRSRTRSSSCTRTRSAW